MFRQDSAMKYAECFTQRKRNFDSQATSCKDVGWISMRNEEKNYYYNCYFKLTESPDGEPIAISQKTQWGSESTVEKKKNRLNENK